MKTKSSNYFTKPLLAAIAISSISAVSQAQIEVSEDGSVKLGNMSVSADGDVKMDGLSTDSEGNVTLGNMSVSADGDVRMDGLSTDSEGNVSLGNISVGADGSVILPGLRVENNGSVSMGSNFDADTLSDSIDDEGESANLNVLFESGSATLTAAGRVQIEEVADAILYLGSAVTIEIQGHTDSVGSDQDNLTLSTERARSVVNELKNEHALPTKLVISGKGEVEPVADNESPTGRQLNRRVTLINLGSS